MQESDLLISQAQQGKAQAFQELLEKYYALIYRLAYRFAPLAEEAEDIAQEVCVKLVDKLASFRGESKFSTWLYQLTLNVYRDRAKQQGARRQREKNYTQVAQQKADAAFQDQRRWLYENLAKMDQSVKETAILVLAEGLSHQEAGEVLGCSESTISWRMHELRQVLQELKD